MPQRHLSTDGNPYYSLSLTSIICNCLQTLRYPAAWLVFLFGSSNELHVEIEPVIDKDAFIHITSYPEDVYFPEDCGIILNKLTIRLTQVSHLAQPSSSLLKWDGSKFERLSSQIRAVRPSWEHSTEVLPHLHG
ncbi:hypothetical protein EMCRGX_G001468 [Ephydatia muelleri]